MIINRLLNLIGKLIWILECQISRMNGIQYRPSIVDKPTITFNLKTGCWHIYTLYHPNKFQDHEITGRGGTIRIAMEDYDNTAKLYYEGWIQ